MDSQRNILLIAFIIVCFWVWQTWQQDHAPKPPVTVVQNSAATGQASASFDANSSLPGEEHATGVNGRQITVKTDVLDVTIDTKGGDINNAALLKYTKHLGSSEPLSLLQTSPSYIYQARSGLVGPNGLDNLSPQRGGRVVYTTDKVNYALPDGQDEIRVPLVYQTPNVTYTKTFIFKRGQYDVKVEYHIDNRTSNTLNYQMFADLKQSNELPKDLSGKSASGFGLHVYRGAAYSSDEKNYKKYDFGDIEKKNLDLESKGGWVAMLQQYFATAWVPSQNSQNTFYTLNSQYLKADQSAIGFRGQPFSVEPNSTGSVGATLWVGPEIQSQMAAIAPHLDLTVDYGWLWFISQPLFKLLKFIQSFVVNWGVAIIIITFIVRGIMYPLTKAQYTSMAKMKLLQPRIQAMRERLGDDRQRLSQEMMALYKQEKVNPLGGCFPIVIQMPIFLALFYMLSGSVELRHAPFAFWIHDLSAQDPYYIMPILMGATMFLIQKMSPTPVTDPMQQKLMTFMPVIFTVFFLWFPSGLVLYYIVSNLVTITQQKLIYRGLEKRGLHTREKKKK